MTLNCVARLARTTDLRIGVGLIKGVTMKKIFPAPNPQNNQYYYYYYYCINYYYWYYKPRTRPRIHYYHPDPKPCPKRPPRNTISGGGVVKTTVTLVPPLPFLIFLLLSLFTPDHERSIIKNGSESSETGLDLVHSLQLGLHATTVTTFGRITPGHD